MARDLRLSAKPPFAGHGPRHYPGYGVKALPTRTAPDLTIRPRIFATAPRTSRTAIRIGGRAGNNCNVESPVAGLTLTVHARLNLPGRGLELVKHRGRVRPADKRREALAQA